MKTKAIYSFFVLFAIVAGIGATTPAAFADHAEVTIGAADNSGIPTDCNVGWPDSTTSDCYTPSTAIVDVGGVVTMINSDASKMMHTFTSGTGIGDELSGVTFDSAYLTADMSYTWTPEVAGEVPYYCQLHPWMIGIIIVQEAEAEEAAAEAQAEADAAAEAQAEADAAAEAQAEADAAAEAQAEADAAAEAQAEADAAAEAQAEADAAAEAQAEADAAAEAQAEADAAAEDVELVVTITDSVMGDGTHVYLEFSEIHVNYQITAMQNGEEIFTMTDHAMEMTGANHHIDAVGSDESPIDIEIVSLGIGAPGAEDDWTGPTGSVATTQVVPEFGTIAMMVLVVAIISIVAVTAKSRVVPRF